VFFGWAVVTGLIRAVETRPSGERRDWEVGGWLRVGIPVRGFLRRARVDESSLEWDVMPACPAPHETENLSSSTALHEKCMAMARLASRLQLDLEIK